MPAAVSARLTARSSGRCRAVVSSPAQRARRRLRSGRIRHTEQQEGCEGQRAEATGEQALHVVRLEHRPAHSSAMQLVGGSFVERARQVDAQLAVRIDIARGESVVGRVPDRRHDLMVAQVVLERCLVLRSPEDQPPGRRIAHPVAEDGVEAPRQPVDEVVHVALERAVVGTGENQPPAVVDGHPAREVDRAHACQVVAVVDVAIGVVETDQHTAHRQAAQPAGLDQADRGERVLRGMVFGALEVVGVLSRGGTGLGDIACALAGGSAAP